MKTSLLRRTCIVLAFLLFFTFTFCNCVFADVQPYIRMNAEYDVFNEQIVLDLFIENNPGIVCLKGRLDYDSESLKLVSVTDKGVLGGSMFETTGKGLAKDPYVLMWYDMSAAQGSVNNNSNGLLVTLKFDVVNSESDSVGFTFTEDLLNTKNAKSETVVFNTDSFNIIIPESVFAVSYDELGRMNSVAQFNPTLTYSSGTVLYGISKNNIPVFFSVL